MSAAFRVPSPWVAGESTEGVSRGNGVNVLDGGGLFSDFVACCLFLSYLSWFIRKRRALGLGIRTRALARAAFAFLSSVSDILGGTDVVEAEVNWSGRQRQSGVG